MKRLLAIFALLSITACENPNQKRETLYYSLCMPGNACLSPAFAINRLRRDIYVKYDYKKRRFVQTTSKDPQVIILHPEGIVDFWREPVYVMATPLVLPTNEPHIWNNGAVGPTPTP